MSTVSIVLPCCRVAVLPRCCVCQWFTLNSCNCFLNKDYRTFSSPKTFWATQYIWWRYSCRNPNTHGKIGGRLASPISNLPLRNHTSADCSVSCERVDRKVLVSPWTTANHFIISINRIFVAFDFSLGLYGIYGGKSKPRLLLNVYLKSIYVLFDNGLSLKINSKTFTASFFLRA